MTLDAAAQARQQAWPLTRGNRRDRRAAAPVFALLALAEAIKSSEPRRMVPFGSESLS